MESISASFVSTSIRLDTQPVAVNESSIATGSSLVQVIVTVTIHGLIASEPRPKASNARNENVDIQQ